MALPYYHRTLAPYQDMTAHIQAARIYAANPERGGFLYIWIHNIPVILSTHGREYTERLLLDIEYFLKQHLSLHDSIILLDKDHYGIVLGNCTKQEMDEKALALFQAIIHYEGADSPSSLPIQLGAMIGGADFSVPSDSAEDIINKAYIALHDAKDLYRHYMHFSDHAYRIQTSQQEMARAHYLQHALSTNRLCLAFQPVIDRVTLKPVFYEALLRMVDESGNLTTIGPFIPAAEKIGFIDMIDRTAFSLAVKELSIYPSLSLSVNVSSITLQQPEWINHTLAQLENRNLASRLILEVTETFEYHELAPLAEVIAQFKARGCKIAIDDFGSGHTSLAQIHMLPIDIIKIDGDFVRHMLKRDDHFAFVQTIIELGHRLGLKTVAEFVEDIPIAEATTALQVDYMQGHYFANATTTRPWLTSHLHDEV